MTHSGCGSVRRALLEGRPAEEAHLARCPACVRFARGLERLDATLEGETGRAAGVELPPALRARILAAVPAPERREDAGGGRVIELALRAVAVAAVLVAGFVALPSELRAGELDLSALHELEGRVRTVVAEAPPISWPVVEPALPQPPLESPWWLAGSGIVLLAAGLVAAKAGERTS